MRPKEISQLIYNPIWTGLLLHTFLSGATTHTNKGLRLEILYIALPIIFDDVLRSKLVTCNVRSTFSTLFNTYELKNRLIGVDKRILTHRETTNKALQVIGTKVVITNEGHFLATELVDYKKSPDIIKDYLKAAYNLGSILSKNDCMDILLNIGANA